MDASRVAVGDDSVYSKSGLSARRAAAQQPQGRVSDERGRESPLGTFASNRSLKVNEEPKDQCGACAIFLVSARGIIPSAELMIEEPFYNQLGAAERRYYSDVRFSAHFGLKPEIG